MKSSRGFSLIEVLVALVIVALTVPAFIQLTVTQTDGVYYAKRTVEAQWVADYVIANRELYSGKPGDWDRASGRVEMFGSTWHWRVEVVETEVENFNQAFVRIYSSEAPDSLLHEVIRYGE